MALRLFKYAFNQRFLSTSSNSILVENLAKSSIARYLGDINELLTAAPELNRYPTEQFEKSFNSLRKAGFNSLKFAYMISQHPRIIAKTPDKIELAANQWRSLNFGDKATMQLLERYPELLDIKNFYLLSENISAINAFVGQKNGYKVLRNSPNVATEQTSLINEKIEYLRDTMQVDPVEVYKSDVFSHDLMTIKTRHIFLERLGMYFKKKKGDNNDAHEINKNPKLSKIVDTSDKRFATKVCHVTLEEYETFVEMYKEELDKRTRKYEDQFEETYSDDEEDENQYKKRR